EAANVGEHPRMAGAADDRNLQAETLSVREVILNALTKLFRVRELELPLQIAGEQRVTVERLACQAFELLNRVEALAAGAAPPRGKGGGAAALGGVSGLSGFGVAEGGGSAGGGRGLRGASRRRATP